MRFLSQFINFKIGLIGAMIMRGLAFNINNNYGWQTALIAALKQGIYTLVFGGLIIKFCEKYR